jgi:hypothetical protein
VPPVAKHLRLRELIQRLRTCALASSHNNARRLIADTLNAVEDELSGVRFNPDSWRTDGRMYPVQDDNVADVDGFPNVSSYRSRYHETFIADNGAFEIRDVRTGEVLISKLGSDGKGVWS